jgi:hypothetical protein
MSSSPVIKTRPERLALLAAAQQTIAELRFDAARPDERPTPPAAELPMPEMTRDLFGDPCLPATAPGRGPQGGKHYTVPRGYAAMPGSGPAGETCSTCKFISRFARFRKCELYRPRWTHGPGTDILARAPACSRWQQPESAALE